jgi:serine phosphatase RsbU (regulator of sigma subunit)/anti-sigma regulatory factor (Ser/Thr protein kinase)
MNGVALIRPQACVLDVPCDLHAVREACRVSRQFLSDCGLEPAELDAWELALAEAANNAVQYVREGAESVPIRFALAVHDAWVEARLTDQTPGFDIPEHLELPDPEAESGRGLFLIGSLTDSMSYLRGVRENCLVLRRERKAPRAGAPAAPDVHQALAEALRTLDLMTEELASSYESLAAIFRFSGELQAGPPSDEFARRWLDQLIGITEADWFVLRLGDSAGNRLRVAAASVADWQGQPLSLDVSADVPGVELRAAGQRVDVAFDAQSPLAAGDPLAAFGAKGCGFAHPMLVKDTLVGLLVIGRRQGDRPFTAGQISVIQTFADFLGLQIRNHQFQEAQVRTHLAARDLEIAAGIQHSLLPEQLPSVPGIALAGFYRSAREVGGDYYDAIPTSGGNLMLVVADVMGKGLPAALFAFMFRSLVRSQREQASRPGEFLSWLNRNLFVELDRAGMFITAQIAYFDRELRELRVAAAGHPPLLIATPCGGTCEVGTRGVPLGVEANEVFPEERVAWGGGPALMFTDGLIEARNPAQELLGLDAVRAVVRDAAQRGASCMATKDRVVSLLHSFESGSPANDDTAFIVFADERGPGI